MTMPPLKGHVVIITGASSGIGAAAAVRFAREGCRTVLAARRMERLEQLAAQIRETGGQALPVAMDVSQPAQIEAMVRSALDAYGRIDILFNNAGFGRLDWLEALDPVEDIQAQLSVDLLGVILAARLVLPQMYLQRSGHIINMASMAGWIAPPLFTIYSAGKFGVRGFKSPAWLTLSADDIAMAVVGVARHPRRELITPWFMILTKFLNAHLNGLSDRVLSGASGKYH